MPANPGILPWDTQALLKTESLGRRMYYLSAVDSTNRVAAELARDGEREGTVVVSDFQSAGRGRRHRRWMSPAGRNLLFSIILRPERAPVEVLPLTLVYSLAIAELLTDRLRTDVSVKWPNDVVTPAGKLCGILAESTTRAGRATRVIAGVGINVNMRLEEFPAGVAVASCWSLTGMEHDRRSLLADVLGGLERVQREFFAKGFDAFVDRYGARLSIRGKAVAFRRRGGHLTGKVTGVREDGGLCVHTADEGLLTLYDEEITVR